MGPADLNNKRISIPILDTKVEVEIRNEVSFFNPYKDTLEYWISINGTSIKGGMQMSSQMGTGEILEQLAEHVTHEIIKHTLYHEIVIKNKGKI